MSQTSCQFEHYRRHLIYSYIAIKTVPPGKYKQTFLEDDLFLLIFHTSADKLTYANGDTLILRYNIYGFQIKEKFFLKTVKKHG